MTYYLLFRFILDCRNGVRKQIQVIFLFVIKQQRQFATSTMHLAQQLLMNIQCSAGSRSCAKETRALKTRSAVAANGSWQRPTERVTEADPLQLHNSTPTILVIHHLKQIGKVKKLDKWMPHELTENFKKSSFWSVFLYCTQEQWTISQTVMFDEKWILHDNQLWPDQWLDWEEAPKHFPKPNVHQKTGHGHWWSAASLIHYSFLNPSKTITSEKYAQQINEMHWKLPTPQPALVNRTGPTLLHTNAQLCGTQPHVKSWKNWVTKLCLICHIHLTSCQPTTTPFSISTTFCREKASTTSRKQKMLFKSSSNPEAHIFYATGINLFFHWQKCVDCNGSFLINKDVFELSYNDLKSTVQNRNYFYTNLITVEDFPGDAVYKNPPVNAGTQVLSLLPEDSTYCRATKPVHNSWSPWGAHSRAHKPPLLSLCTLTTEACSPRACAPQQKKPPRWEARTLQRRGAPARCNQRKSA